MDWAWFSRGAWPGGEGVAYQKSRAQLRGGAAHGPRPAVTHLELARPCRWTRRRTPRALPTPVPARSASASAAPGPSHSPHEPGIRTRLLACGGKWRRGPRTGDGPGDTRMGGALTVQVVLQVHGSRHLRPRPRSGSAQAGGAARSRGRGRHVHY